MMIIGDVFNCGASRPAQPAISTEGNQVDPPLSAPQGDSVALMKARFPDSFGCMPAEDADEIMRLIDMEFGRADSN